MILVAGSANLDFVVRAAHIPAPGETVLGHGLQTHPGGKGANQAVACARAGGAATHMLLGLGADAHAEPLEQSLQGAGVSLHTLRCEDVATGTAFICVSDGGENAITVASGANHALRAEHLPPLQGFTHLLMQLETPLDTVLAYARAARREGVTVALNAAPAQALPDALIAQVDLLIVNEGELASITGATDSIAAGLQQLQVPQVVVTLGARGCCARLQGEYLLQPGFAVQPVDTTGAGDTFCGTLVAALSLGLDWPEALRRATAASALACTQAGAQTSIPAAEAVDAFLQAQPPASEAQITALRQFCALP
jgi:ribokinase